MADFLGFDRVDLALGGAGFTSFCSTFGAVCHAGMWEAALLGCSFAVTSKAKQLGTWRISNYTPEYRETSGVGKRKLMTMDEVLRMDVDRALVILRE